MKNIILCLFIVFGIITASCKNSKPVSMDMQDLKNVTLPYHIKTENGYDVLLISLDSIDVSKGVWGETILYTAIKDSIGANDLFLEYIVRSDSGEFVTEETIIVRYIPTENNDYKLSEVYTLINLIKPAGFAEPSLLWFDKDLLSDQENDIKRLIFDIYKAKKTR